MQIPKVFLHIMQVFFKYRRVFVVGMKKAAVI